MPSGLETRTFTVNTLSSVVGSLLLAGATALWQHLHGHSIDWYGIAGLFVLAGSLFLLLLWVTRRRNPEVPQETSGTPWKTREHWRELYESKSNEKDELQQVHDEEVRKLEATQKAELGRANEFTRQCEIDRQEALGRVRQLEAQLSLFTPLQVDTLTLSKELLQFLADMGSRPEVSAEMFLYDSRGNRRDSSIVIQEHMAATNRVLLPWIAKARSNFKTDLLPKLEDISLRYGKLGIGVDLVPHSEEYLLANRWFFDVSLELVKLAHGIDTMKIVPMLDKI